LHNTNATEISGLKPLCFGAMDGFLILASVTAIVICDAHISIRDYPGQVWPKTGSLEAATQVAGWILFGMFFAGPFVLGRRRLLAPGQSWDCAEHTWFWVPAAWHFLFLLSLITPEHPILIMLVIPLLWVFPLMIIVGCFSLCKSAKLISDGGSRWTSVGGAIVAILFGLYGVASVLRHPPII
jgi:hypothetical protein